MLICYQSKLLYFFSVSKKIPNRLIYLDYDSLRLNEFVIKKL